MIYWHGAELYLIDPEVMALSQGAAIGTGVKMLSDVDWNSRNMVIFAVSLSIGLGLMQEPGALQHLPETAQPLLTTGLLPAAFTAILLNLFVPHRADD